ncbi:MAG TPA: aminotransferase class I/II-fold pyridoxal phosphate-dependent enzyme [Solirubrobacteraceae bacterium]|nr:aminotransferase class I/II-fold pyridoxal phosphate-dependent enzyme [Solirubrobacteraceae bacterium]
MRLSPVLAGLATYPFVRLDEAKAAALARGVEVIDFGAGEPREETPAFIRRAVAEAIEAEPVSGYPKAEGLPALRAAIAEWVGRRFGARLDPDTEVVPTLGSKEAIFHLAHVVGGPGARVATTTPGYPVPARGAMFAGAGVLELRLEPERGWQPDLEDVDWDGVAILWLNSPNNPTAATASLELYERAAELARAHGFVLACDEAYSELWFAGDPPVSALQVADRRSVVVFNTLSKRSSMPGYRSGFAAGDADLIAAMKRFRPNVGTAPPTFVQRAAVTAWGDEEHVVETRARYAAKREVILPALRAVGLEPAGGDASFFLWLRIGPAHPGQDAEAFALRLLDDLGLVVAPGPFFGPGGEGHVRAALVPTVDECRRAADLLASWA